MLPTSYVIVLLYLSFYAYELGSEMIVGFVDSGGLIKYILILRSIYDSHNLL